MSDTPDYKRVELVWPGKKTQVERVKLPFQVIERVNEVRRSDGGQAPLLQRELPEWWPEGWRNKLIWGDNKYVLASLLDEFAGKVDLIYIDPPFAVGQDFSYQTTVGDLTLAKASTAFEEVAYRDTWGAGLPSYLQMLYDRLLIMRDLLKDGGSIFVHVGVSVAHAVRLLMEEIFGSTSFQNEVIWQRHDPHNDAVSRFGFIHDNIYWFSKGPKATYYPNQGRRALSEAGEKEFSLLELPDGRVVNYKGNEHLTGRRFKLDDATWKGNNPNKRFVWRGATPSPRREWMYDYEGMEAALARGELYLRDPARGAARCRKRYLDENQGILLQDIWTNAGRMKGGSDYPTQKPEELLERIIGAATKPGDLVLDAFAGSGTTMVAAEKLGRRWIGCDLGRFAIQTSRKRLLDIRARPFEVLNLGRYERRYWQGATAGEAIGEYYRFIVELFHGEVIPGFAHLHGVKAGHLIHVGATDAPVTERELRNALEECKANGFTDLDVLGWEWEMGLNRDGAERLAREFGVKLRLFNIPREVMDKRAVDAGDVHFFELSVADLQAHVNRNEAIIELCGFLPAIDDYMRKKVGDADLKWSDWVDYWSVDFEYDGETFINQWQSYRTRKNRTLVLWSDPHRYDKPGAYTVVVKVIDIFGNDTTQQLTVDIK